MWREFTVGHYKMEATIAMHRCHKTKRDYTESVTAKRNNDVFTHLLA